MPLPFSATYSFAIGLMYEVSCDKGDWHAAENWATDQLVHCEEVYGVSHGLTFGAVFDLEGCLEIWEKWDEACALRREWKDVLDPPEIAGWIEEMDERERAQREVTDGTEDRESGWPMQQDIDDQYDKEMEYM